MLRDLRGYVDPISLLPFIRLNLGLIFVLAVDFFLCSTGIGFQSTSWSLYYIKLCYWFLLLPYTHCDSIIILSLVVLIYTFILSLACITRINWCCSCVVVEVILLLIADEHFMLIWLGNVHFPHLTEQWFGVIHSSVNGQYLDIWRLMPRSELFLVMINWLLLDLSSVPAHMNWVILVVVACYCLISLHGH
jgi:hypothetical protein